MQRWGLHRRIALNTIRLVGTRPAAVVGGFMIATAFLSMWVSNTATVVMMLPIALSVIELVRRELGRSDDTVVKGQAGSFHFATSATSAINLGLNHGIVATMNLPIDDSCGSGGF